MKNYSKLEFILIFITIFFAIEIDGQFKIIGILNENADVTGSNRSENVQEMNKIKESLLKVHIMNDSSEVTDNKYERRTESIDTTDDNSNTDENVIKANKTGNAKK